MFVPSKDKMASWLRVPNEDPKEFKFKKVLGQNTGGMLETEVQQPQHKTVSF